MTQTASPIGGQLISSFGGMLGFCPFQGNTSVENDNYRNYLDCKSWQLYIKSIFDDTTGTGHFGAQGNNRTAEVSSFIAEIMWDLNAPPPDIQKYGQTGLIIPNWDLGVRMTFLLGDNANYPSDKGAEYYYCPSMKPSVQVPIIDANSKKMIGFHMEGLSNARTYRMPAESSELSRYITHLATRNWVF